MTVEVGKGSSGTRFIKRDWPIEEGLEAGTTKQEGRKMSLEPEADNLLSSDDEVGL